MNFIIKDLFGTEHSAKSIELNIVKPLIRAKNDINLEKIIVLVNGNFKYEIEDAEIVNTEAKHSFADFHNVAVSLIKDLKNVHIISGSLALNPGKYDAEGRNENYVTYIGAFINHLMNLLNILKRDIWFSTASDAANFSFGKYFTTTDILNVDGKCDIEFPECMMWAGNSNLDWIFVKEYSDDLIFNNEYDYDFLSIKECIAQNAKKVGYFVNLFPTIPHEVGAFWRIPEFDLDKQKYDLAKEKYESNISLFATNTSFPENRFSKIPDVIEYMKEILR